MPYWLEETLQSDKPFRDAYNKLADAFRGLAISDQNEHAATVNVGEHGLLYVKEYGGEVFSSMMS